LRLSTTDTVCFTQIKRHKFARLRNAVKLDRVAIRNAVKLDQVDIRNAVKFDQV